MYELSCDDVTQPTTFIPHMNKELIRITMLTYIMGVSEWKFTQSVVTWSRPIWIVMTL